MLDLIDLIPIVMVDVCVIVGMDCLSRFGALIDCERQMVRVRDPSGGCSPFTARELGQDQLFVQSPG